jgi:hypothetical protein
MGLDFPINHLLKFFLRSSLPISIDDSLISFTDMATTDIVNAFGFTAFVFSRSFVRSGK